MNNTTSKTTYRDIGLLVLLAFAYRAGLWLAVPRVLDTADAIHYLGVAKAFGSGEFFRYFDEILPLYPLLCAIVNLATGELELAARLTSFIASVALIVPVYFLSRDLHGVKAARFTSLVVALWPWVADYGLSVAPEATAVLFWLAAVWLLVRGLRDRGRWWMPTAALAFFALHLTRPEGTFVWLAAPIGAAAVYGAGGRIPWRRVAVFAGLSTALLVIYGLYMREVTGSFMINARIRLFLEPGTASGAPKALIPFEPEQGDSVMAEYLKTVIKMITEVPLIMLGPVVWLFAGMGLFGRGENRRDLRGELVVIWCALVQWAVILGGHSPAPRYIMATLVAATLWAGRGMALVTEQAGRLPRFRWTKTLPLTALVLFMAFWTAITVGSEHAGRRPRQPREYKAVGLWMREHLEPGLVLTRKPQVGYYADMATTGPASGETLEQTLERARELGVRYIVVDERYTTQVFPAFRPLLDPETAPPGLRCLHTLDLYPESRVVVYELTGA